MGKSITVDYDLDDVSFRAEFWVTPYDPGVISGPPEKCYPPEGGAEIEWLKVRVHDTGMIGMGQHFDCDLSCFEDVVDRMAEMAYDEYIEGEEDTRW